MSKARKYVERQLIQLAVFWVSRQFLKSRPGAILPPDPRPLKTISNKRYWREKAKAAQNNPDDEKEKNYPPSHSNDSIIG